MDTPTQALLGATVAQAGFSGRLGWRRAALYGAAAGIVPDLDVVVNPFLGRMGEFLFHRGPTHSFWFGPLFGVLIGYAVWQRYRRSYARNPNEWRGGGSIHPGSPGARSAWISLWIAALFTHPLLDIFTTYGTQFLWPFSFHRFALNGVGIVDPHYSLVLIAGLAGGWTWRAQRRKVRWAAVVALILTTGYVLFGWQLNHRAEAEARRQLAAAGVQQAQVRCYPTLLQVFLRRCVVRQPDQVRIGYLTLWNPGPITWETFEQDTHSYIDKVKQTREGEVFTWFAMDQTASHLEKTAKGYRVIIDDIRYGLPGTPDRGFWALRAKLAPDGALRAPPDIVGRPREGNPMNLAVHMLRYTFALEADVAMPAPKNRTDPPPAG